jgi:hypothetical protein
MTKRNNGVYEPEFRLVLMLPAVILGSIGTVHGGVYLTIGYFGFGWSIEEGDPWIVPVILYGLVGIGGVFLAIPVYTYVVDSHRALAPEAFVTVSPSYPMSYPSHEFISLSLRWFEN